MSDFTYNSFPIPAKPLSGVGETSYLSALLGIAPGGVKKVPTASFLAAAGVYPVALLQCTPQITQVIGDVAANTTLIPLIADTSVSGGDTGVSTGGMSVGDSSPNTGKIVISEAGLYRVSCSIRITRTSSDGGECGAVILKNGSSVITSVYDEADTDDHFTLTCPTVIASLASGDVLSLNAAIVGGSSESIYVNGASLLPEDVPTPTSVVLVERLNSASGDSSSTESLAELAAEVQDAREGYDGTEYASLGAAIRSQVAIAMASGISEDVKTALLNAFAHVAWVDEDGQDYYDALDDALNAKTLTSISATFTQGGNLFFTTDPLNYLKQCLVVTAYYSDSTSEAVQDYELSGSLVAGTCTITVTYATKTTTFDVTVTAWGTEWTYTDGEPQSGGLFSNWSTQGSRSMQSDGLLVSCTGSQYNGWTPVTEDLTGTKTEILECVFTISTLYATTSTNSTYQNGTKFVSWNGAYGATVSLNNKGICTYNFGTSSYESVHSGIVANREYNLRIVTGVASMLIYLDGELVSTRTIAGNNTHTRIATASGTNAAATKYKAIRVAYV